MTTRTLTPKLMNETKHTPAPWNVNIYETKNATNPRQVTVIAPGMTIRVSGLLQHQDANARLIAAAPDLLVTLEHILADPFTVISKRSIELARAAIAAAKGETP